MSTNNHSGTTSYYPTVFNCRVPKTLKQAPTQGSTYWCIFEKDGEFTMREGVWNGTTEDESSLKIGIFDNEELARSAVAGLNKIRRGLMQYAKILEP